MMLALLLLEGFEPREQVAALGDGAGGTHVRMPDHALGIDQEHRAAVDASFIIEDAIGFADRAVRPVIGEQGKRQPAELLRPGLEAGHGVGADLENFCV